MEAVQFPRYEKYKDSGVPWLGEIPEHWEVTRNFGLFDERKEVNKPEMELLAVTIKHGVIKQSEITTKKDSSNEDKSKYKAVFKGDLAYNKMRMWQGAIGESKFDGIVSPAYIILNTKNKAYSRYFHYLYRTEDFIREANRHSYGLCDDMNSLRYEDFKTIYSPTPPEKDVVRIIEFLDQKMAEIDTAIAKKQQLIQLLNEQKAILINRAVTKGLNPNVKMKDSGVAWIGEIPEHWAFFANRALFSETNNPGNADLPILTVSLHTGVSNEEQSAEENVRAKIRIENKANYKRVNIGDIVFNMMRAWQGAIGAVRVEGMVSPAYIVATPKYALDSDYFEYLYRTTLYIEQMNRYSKGITDFRKRLYWDEFKQLQTLLPPIDEQVEIAKYCSLLKTSTEEVIEHEHLAIGKLRELKQTLITHATTGKIKV